MIKTATPTVFPQPGTYQVYTTVTLLCETPGASLHYTTDGSQPSGDSPLYDPYRMIALDAGYDGFRGLSKQFNIRAIALKDGLQASDPADFTYSIARRDKNVYRTQEIHPGVWMIRDHDDDRMFVVKGRNKALLIDTGFGHGDLRGEVQALTGELPLEVAITHAHPDHVGQLEQFQADFPIYMHPYDLPLVKEFIQRIGFKIDPTRLQPFMEGFVFDLGGIRLRVYEVPGHTPGEVVLHDEKTGRLYAGDAVGSNRAANADSLWMQFEGMAPIDEYLSSLRVFRSKVSGLKEIYTGHNDEPLGEGYLDNLELACQQLVDNGPECLVPSPRPVEAWQSVVGDRLTDPNWAAINVSREHCLSMPFDKIASLSNLQLQGAALNERFLPDRLEYTASTGGEAESISIRATSSSSRASRLTIDGQPARSGEALRVDLNQDAKRIEVAVTSPDGSEKRVYGLRFFFDE